MEPDKTLMKVIEAPQKLYHKSQFYKNVNTISILYKKTEQLVAPQLLCYGLQSTKHFYYK